ncbi:DUF72 domain-containing protein [Thioflavicoccus mobilis]|uniref:DUF72 domain-containing protein n=1 Tax=Thioflavicoccus mobilis TaxID=80679 RepID=UPI003CCBC43B
MTADFVCVRLHGPGSAYRGDYDQAALAAWAERIGDWRDQGRDVYLYIRQRRVGLRRAQRPDGPGPGARADRHRLALTTTRRPETRARRRRQGYRSRPSGIGCRGICRGGGAIGPAGRRRW